MEILSFEKITFLKNVGDLSLNNGLQIHFSVFLFFFFFTDSGQLGIGGAYNSLALIMHSISSFQRMGLDIYFTRISDGS